MAKTKAPSKITDAELKEVQKYVNALNQAQMNIGQIELQKATILSDVKTMKKGLTDIQESLRKIYGDVDINLLDGTISKNAADPKN